MKEQPHEVRGRRDLPSREEEARELGEPEVEEDEKLMSVSDEEHRCINAKMYLMSASTDTGQSLWV